MADMPWDSQGEAQTALRAIVADRRYGPAALSDPQMLAYALQHMLPNAQRESNVLVAASKAGVPGMLQQQMSQGTDLSTTHRLTTASFENQTTLAPDACSWAVSALATALRSEPSGAWQTRETAAPGGYQPSPAGGPAPGAWAGVRPAARTSHSGPNGLRIAGAALAAAGAGLIIWACALPYLTIPGSSGQTSFSLFNSGGGNTWWYVAEPVGVAAIGIAAALIVLLANHSARLRSTAAGVLIGFGIQTVLLFAGYRFAFRSPDHAGPAGTVGMLAGIVLLAAGLLAAFSREKTETA